MRQSRTSGSVGDLGGQPPRSTRPIQHFLWGNIITRKPHASESRPHPALHVRPKSTLTQMLPSPSNDADPLQIHVRACNIVLL